MTIERTITLEELRDLVGKVGKKLPMIARIVMRASVQAMQRDVVRNRMSGQYLGVVTGTARKSMRGEVDPQAERIRGLIGTPLRYVRAHEEGFKGPVQVRAHTRRLHATRVVKKGKRAGQRVSVPEKRRLQYALSGKRTSAHVRAHTRQMNIRARRFMRDTLQQEAGGLPGLLAGTGAAPFTRRMVKALSIYVEQRRIPRVADLGV